jgi:hypothetical protein
VALLRTGKKVLTRQSSIINRKLKGAAFHTKAAPGFK